MINIPGNIIRAAMSVPVKTVCFRGYINNEGQHEYKCIIQTIQQSEWNKQEFISCDWLELEDKAMSYLDKLKPKDEDVI